MAEYNEEAVAAFAPVKASLTCLGLPFMVQRKFTGILNAIEMQIEDDAYSMDVVYRLGEALLALMDQFGLQAHKPELKSAFKRFTTFMAGGTSG